MRTTEWTIATWATRESATYVGIDKHIGNVVIDAYGRRSDQANYLAPIPRRPFKVEEGETVSYVMFEDDAAGPRPIIRITEETANAEEEEQ